MRSKAVLILATICASVMVAANVTVKEWPSEKEKSKTAKNFYAPQQWMDRSPPDFELQLLNKGSFKLSEHIGKRAIIINFFATWCGPCRREMPEFMRIHGQYGGKDVLLLAVNANEKLAAVENFVDEYDILFPVGIDHGDAVGDLYNVRSYPTTVFIGTDGRVKLYKIGQIVNADVAFKPLIEKSIALIRADENISKEEYLVALENQSPLPDPYEDTADGEDVGKERLDGRALDIARKMSCPCGCEDMVEKCKCSTAKSIRKKLSDGNFQGKSDEEIIKELSKEFCVGNG